MPFHNRPARRVILAGTALVALSACEPNGFDFDLRSYGGGFSTTQALQSQAQRPTPDARGIISYPNYQVVVARQGDTVTTVAGRIGMPAEELARFNGLPVDARLRDGEVLALPRRVSETAGTGGGVDITSLAGSAIDRASGGQSAQPSTISTETIGDEPLRHQVARGETAYSIARLYKVSVRSLADWNGLGPDMSVREGQYLMIPPAQPVAAQEDPVSQPGEGSVTPTPPSATQPLPEEEMGPGAETEEPASPEMASTQTAASQSAMMMPVDGKIIRPFEKGKTDGIDIAASAGDAVRAAADGIVAAITRNTDQVPILVIRHPGNILTVYANIDNIAVEKGDTVKRGQQIATVRAGSPAFLHFQVREGTASVDPMDYLN